MKWMLRLLLPLLALALACGGTDGSTAATGDIPDTGKQTPTNEGTAECAADADCAAGQGCALPAGLCIAFYDRHQVFSVAVDPGEGSDLVTDQIAGLAVEAGGTMNLSVTPPATLYGIVALRTGTGSEPMAGGMVQATDTQVSGQLVATATGMVPGTQFRSDAVVTAPANPALTDASAPTYTMKIASGLVQPFQVAFLPDARPDDTDLPALPPYFVTTQLTGGRFDLLLPGRSEYTRVSGNVVMHDGGKAGVVASAQVTCSTATTDKATTSLSSVATTTAEGRFDVVVLGQGPVTLRVSPGAASPLFAVKEFALTPKTGAVDATSKIDAGTLDLGDRPPTRDIAVQVLDTAQQTAIASALVQATADDGTSTVAVTGSDGVAKLALLDGHYKLAVMPDPSTPFAATWVDLAVDSAVNANRMMLLAPRLAVTGKVVRQSTGAGVPRAVVTLATNRVNALLDVSQGLQEVAFTATTADDGSFTLAVDPGRYALTVVPPAESRLARYSQPDLTLAGGNQVMSVPLPEAALIHGVVTRQSTDATAGAAGTTPVAGAHVQLFYDVPAGGTLANVWSVQDAALAAMVQLAGEATSDANGHFSMVVPLLLATSDGAFSDGKGGQTATPGGLGESTTFGLPAVVLTPVP